MNAVVAHLDQALHVVERRHGPRMWLVGGGRLSVNSPTGASRSPFAVQQSGVQGEADQLGPGADVELAGEPDAVRFDGLGADREPGGDGAAGVAPGDEAQDLPLALAEAVDARVGPGDGGGGADEVGEGLEHPDLTGGEGAEPFGADAERAVDVRTGGNRDVRRAAHAVVAQQGGGWRSGVR